MIQIISTKTLQTIQTLLQEAKYFSIILDCTPDFSHKEQMSLIVCIVDLVPKPNIKEYILSYVEVVETTGLNLSAVRQDSVEGT